MALPRVLSLFTTHPHHHHPHHQLPPIDEDRREKMSLRPEESPQRFAPLTRQLSGLGAKLGNVFGGGSKDDDSSSMAMSDTETLAGGEYCYGRLTTTPSFFSLSTSSLSLWVSRVPGRDKGASTCLARDKQLFWREITLPAQPVAASLGGQHLITVATSASDAPFPKLPLAGAPSSVSWRLSDSLRPTPSAH
ncbi:hypothetical protein BDY19DRAFT_145945 [Irpex rosettiformis]|uniref:Uncharacterized protein n=1 Tax=Irpex rosettiformis TaxID=378272 RepID=A0ACB8U386_9APHY|nr:hypothetical protein BDY19DRAFT_145945 [Irpex rosettiformis]